MPSYRTIHILNLRFIKNDENGHWEFAYSPEGQGRHLTLTRPRTLPWPRDVYFQCPQCTASTALEQYVGKQYILNGEEFPANEIMCYRCGSEKFRSCGFISLCGDKNIEQKEGEDFEKLAFKEQDVINLDEEDVPTTASNATNASHDGFVAPSPFKLPPLAGRKTGTPSRRTSLDGTKLKRNRTQPQRLLSSVAFDDSSEDQDDKDDNNDIDEVNPKEVGAKSTASNSFDAMEIDQPRLPAPRIKKRPENDVNYSQNLIMKDEDNVPEIKLDAVGQRVLEMMNGPGLSFSFDRNRIPHEVSSNKNLFSSIKGELGRVYLFERVTTSASPDDPGASATKYRRRVSSNIGLEKIVQICPGIQVDEDGELIVSVETWYRWLSSELLKKANGDPSFGSWVVYLFDVGITRNLAKDIYNICQDTKLAKIGGDYCLTQIIKSKDDNLPRPDLGPYCYLSPPWFGALTPLHRDLYTLGQACHIVVLAPPGGRNAVFVVTSENQMEEHAEMVELAKSKSFEVDIPISDQNDWNPDVSATVEAKFTGLRFTVGLSQGIHLPANKFHVFRKVFDHSTEAAVTEAAAQWKQMLADAEKSKSAVSLGLIPINPLVGIAWDFLFAGPTKETFKELMLRVWNVYETARLNHLRWMAGDAAQVVALPNSVKSHSDLQQVNSTSSLVEKGKTVNIKKRKREEKLQGQNAPKSTPRRTPTQKKAKTSAKLFKTSSQDTMDVDKQPDSEIRLDEFDGIFMDDDANDDDSDDESDDEDQDHEDYDDMDEEDVPEDDDEAEFQPNRSKRSKISGAHAQNGSRRSSFSTSGPSRRTRGTISAIINQTSAVVVVNDEPSSVSSALKVEEPMIISLPHSETPLDDVVMAKNQEDEISIQPEPSSSSGGSGSLEKDSVIADEPIFVALPSLEERIGDYERPKRMTRSRAKSISSEPQRPNLEAVSINDTSEKEPSSQIGSTGAEKTDAEVHAEPSRSTRAKRSASSRNTLKSSSTRTETSPARVKAKRSSSRRKASPPSEPSAPLSSSIEIAFDNTVTQVVPPTTNEPTSEPAVPVIDAPNVESLNHAPTAPVAPEVIETPEIKTDVQPIISSAPESKREEPQEPQIKLDTVAEADLEPKSISVSKSQSSTFKPKARSTNARTRKATGSKASISNPPPQPVAQNESAGSIKAPAESRAPDVVVQVPWTLIWCIDNALRRRHVLMTSQVQQQHVLGACSMLQSFIDQEKADRMKLAVMKTKISLISAQLHHSNDDLNIIAANMQRNYRINVSAWLNTLTERLTPARSQVVRAPLEGSCSKCLRMHHNIMMVPMPVQGSFQTIGSERFLVPDYAPEPNPIGDESSLCPSCWINRIYSEQMPLYLVSHLFSAMRHGPAAAPSAKYIRGLSRWLTTVIEQCLSADHAAVNDNEGLALNTADLCQRFALLSYRPIACWYPDPEEFWKEALEMRQAIIHKLQGNQ